MALRILVTIRLPILAPATTAMRLATQLAALLLALATPTLTRAQSTPAAPPAGLEIPKDMTPYFLGLIVPGTKSMQTDSVEWRRIVPQHLHFIRQQLEARTFIVAGPTTDGGRVEGMAIIAAKSREEAERLLAQDPAVKAGFAKVELHAALLPSMAGVTIRY